jgi:hypothetical protein
MMVTTYSCHANSCPAMNFQVCSTDADCSGGTCYLPGGGRGGFDSGMPAMGFCFGGG